MGHTNGGDISLWLGNEGKAYISGIITLDHRRVPLPRDSALKVLSIRASDFPADKGVLPTAPEQSEHGSCVVKVDGSRGDDIQTSASRLKADIKFNAGNGNFELKSGLNK